MCMMGSAVRSRISWRQCIVGEMSVWKWDALRAEPQLLHSVFLWSSSDPAVIQVWTCSGPTPGPVWGWAADWVWAEPARAGWVHSAPDIRLRDNQSRNIIIPNRETFKYVLQVLMQSLRLILRILCLSFTWCWTETDPAAAQCSVFSLSSFKSLQLRYSS